jgi:hypothetical protein
VAHQTRKAGAGRVGGNQGRAGGGHDHTLRIRLSIKLMQQTIEMYFTDDQRSIMLNCLVDRTLR